MTTIMFNCSSHGVYKYAAFGMVYGWKILMICFNIDVLMLCSLMVLMGVKQNVEGGVYYMWWGSSFSFIQFVYAKESVRL